MKYASKETDKNFTILFFEKIAEKHQDELEYFDSLSLNLQYELGEDILTEISEKTGARYFRATDSKSLENIISEIDQIEKKRMNQIRRLIPINSYPINLFGLTLVLMLMILFSEAFIFIKYE